jgi:hypothetical protein
MASLPDRRSVALVISSMDIHLTHMQAKNVEQEGRLDSLEEDTVAQQVGC